MLVQCEHFIYVAQDNTGYKLHKSPGVTSLLDGGNLNYLCHVGDKLVEEAYIQMWWPNENLVTVSYISPQHDSFGRQCNSNHTIIFNINSYLQLFPPLTVCTSHFIHDLTQLKTPLKPLNVEAKT